MFIELIIERCTFVTTMKKKRHRNLDTGCPKGIRANTCADIYTASITGVMPGGDHCAAWCDNGVDRPARFSSACFSLSRSFALMGISF